MATDMEPVMSLPASSKMTSPNPSADAQPSSPCPTSSSSTSKKKKKKRRNVSNSAASSADLTENLKPDNFTDSPEKSSTSNVGSVTDGKECSTSLVTDAATVEQWKNRVQSIRSSLTKVQKENQLLSADLSSALARASDAEHAELVVNKGLLSARSVITQRDRSIAELNANVSVLRADLAHLVDEKKKTDKRLILLKTVSDNLRDAREARDCGERKLESANAEIVRLKKCVEELKEEGDALKRQVQAMEMVKQQLSRIEQDLEDVIQEKEYGEVRAHRVSLVAAGLGAISVFTIRFAARMISSNRDNGRN